MNILVNKINKLKNQIHMNSQHIILMKIFNLINHIKMIILTYYQY